MSEGKSLILRGKRVFLVFGLVLLLVASSLMITHFFVIKPDLVFSDSVQMTTTGDYVSSFHAEAGYWIEFALASANRSVLRLNGSMKGEVWRVEHNDEQAYLGGALYNFSKTIDFTDDYKLSLENFAAHTVYPYWYPEAVYDNNTFSGDFTVFKASAYSVPTLISGEVLLLASCGLFVIPVLTFFRSRVKRLGMTL